jgi:beta-lactamase regulating signal transducer with metallopeptidase domain
MTPAVSSPPVKVTLDRTVVALLGAWLLGAIALLSCGLYGQYSFLRRLRCFAATDDSRLNDAVREAARATGIATPPPVIITDTVAFPALCGLLRPRLLLPSQAAEYLTPSQLRHVFLHELAHLKRRDLWIDLMCTVLRAAQWFNPAMWVAFAFYRSDREMARDAMALRAASREQAESYGGTIVVLLERVADRTALPVGALGILERHGGLRRRMMALAGYRPVSGWRSGVVAGALAALVGCASLTSCTSHESAPASVTVAPTTNVSPDAGKEDASTAVTRTYDMRELLVDIPDFTNAPTFSGVPTRPAEPSQPPRKLTEREKIDLLIKKLQQSIDPPSWKQFATIREESKQLVVYQTPKNQDALASLLKTIRENHGMEVTVEARFTQVDLNDLKKHSESQWLLDLITHGGGTLDKDRLDAFLKADQVSVLSTPRFTLFNGQQAYMMMGEQLPYVSDFEVVQKASENSAYEPITSKLSTGVVLDCRSLISADRQYVTLTLAPQISKLQRFHNERWKGSPKGRNDLEVQVPELLASSLHTTVSVPNNQTILMLMSPETDSYTKQPTKASHHLQTLFLVRPMIIPFLDE